MRKIFSVKIKIDDKPVINLKKKSFDEVEESFKELRRKFR